VAAAVYFFLNTGLVAAAVAFSSGCGFGGIWKQNFLWTSPTYFIGALIALLAVAVARAGGRGAGGHAARPGLTSPTAATCAYTERVEQEQRQAPDGRRPAARVIEALTLAIEAKDRTSRHDLCLMQTYAERAGARRRAQRRRGSRREDRSAAARHRQPGGARTHPVETGQAHRRRVRAGQGASQSRRRDSRVDPVPVPGRRAHPRAPRTLGRARLPPRSSGESTSQSERASCRSSTVSWRCWPTARTAARGPMPRPLPRCARTAARRSTRPWSSRSSKRCRTSRHASRALWRAGLLPLRHRSTGPGTALDDIVVAHREEQVLREIAEALTTRCRSRT